MIDVEKYVKDQIAVFQANELLEKRLENRERRPGRGKEGDLSYGPYLLISREKGAGGNTVAQLVGRRLGWRVFNNEIVDEIAQKAHVRRQLIESLDERDQKTIQCIIQDAIGQLLDSQAIGISDYLGYLKQVVLTLGHHGDVVIVGRGARYILPSQFGLSVRMVAPIEVRIRRIADKARLSLEAARIEVERIDRERVKLVRRHFGHNVADPLSHDLTINTGAMNAEAAAEVVLTALQRKLGVQIKESGQK
jgi:cytidylate kinase